MAQKKTVKRTYFSKKQNKYITKTYEYAEATNRRYQQTYKRKQAAKKTGAELPKIPRAKNIITSTGRLTKYGKEFLTKLPTEQRAKYQDVIEYYQATGKGTLTELRLIAKVEQNKVANFISNTGFTAEQVAAELKVSVEDLLDPANWKGNIYTDPVSGKSWKVSFDYQYEGSIDSVFEEIKQTGE